MSEKTIQLEIVTPEGVILKQPVVRATLPTKSGEITVLPGHIPLVSILKPGVIEAELSDGSPAVMFVSGGFIEVLKDGIAILADTAERAEDLDEQKIKEARARAEKMKLELRNADQVDFAAVSVQIEKELARSQAFSRWRRLQGLKTEDKR